MCGPTRSSAPPFVELDESVAKHDRAGGVLGHLVFVGHQDNRASLSVQSGQQWKDFLEYSGRFITLNEHLNRSRTVYNEYKSYYENALRDITKELSYSNVVTHPVVADKKSYPIRWLILTMIVVASLFTTVILIVVYENYNTSKTA